MLILKYATKLNITTIAMINSGGMRAKSLGNDITMEDLLNVFPYENSIDVMELKGGTIRKVLEKSAKLLSPEKPNTGGGFIQVSGKLKNVLIFEYVNQEVSKSKKQLRQVNFPKGLFRPSSKCSTTSNFKIEGSLWHRIAPPNVRNI